MLTILNTVNDLRTRRVGLGLSQAALARSAGLSRTALNLIENGKMRPSLETRNELERCLDPILNPIRLRIGGGALSAASEVSSAAARAGLPYALTLDVAAWLLTGYQTPAAAWAYVRPREEWLVALRRAGARRPRAGERADLMLLRAPDHLLRETRRRGGFRVVSDRQLLADCGRMGGRHTLDAARVYVQFPRARYPGLRLDADALTKVLEEVAPWTSRRSSS
jgi:DNA-binding XRE family transcriptional regulator